MAATGWQAHSVRGSGHTHVATAAAEEALEQGPVLVAHVAPAPVSVPVQLFLDPVPGLIVNDAGLLSGVNLSLVIDAAGVDHVREQMVEPRLVENRQAATG